jgi:hypothetical protein
MFSTLKIQIEFKAPVIRAMKNFKLNFKKMKKNQMFNKIKKSNKNNL